jgi:hypothetical protein
MIRLPEEKRDYAKDGEWHEAFEDFLIPHNPALLRRLRKARQEQLSGKTRSWEEFKRDFTPAPSPWPLVGTGS